MVDPLSTPSSPAAISPRPRTVSTPTRPKLTRGDSWGTKEEDHQPHQPSDSPTRARRTSTTTTSSTTYFSIPKPFSISSSLSLFVKRRKTTSMRSTPLGPSEQHHHVLGDIIEIGPDRAVRDANNEEAERERLRDAAALALGLGLGRDEHAETDGNQDQTHPTPVSDPTTHPQIHEPIPRVPPIMQPPPSTPSSTSFPQRLPTPSVATTSPPDNFPPYPSPLSALTPYIQSRSDILRYHPSGTFLAISLSRRTKQWRLRHVILTALPPSPFAPVDLLAGHRRNIKPQHAHLHLFKHPAPAPGDLEIDRLEINEDSIAFMAENEIAGKRNVIKVGGRDVRGGDHGDGVTSAGSSVKSGRSRGAGGTSSGEQSIEEMGRTMWLLKLDDAGETQRWVGFIKNAVLVQRAERAAVTFPSVGTSNGNGSGPLVPSMRADLEGILSQRSQGFMPSLGTRTETPPQQPTPPPPTSNAAAIPSPNPRYADHVGAAPSRSTPSPSVRTRTYPLTSTSVNLHSFKGLFNTLPPSGPNSRSSSPHRQQDTRENIDPAVEESGSLGTRATALLNIFRSSSRASYTSGHSIAPPSQGQMKSPTPAPTPLALYAPTPRTQEIGMPISPTPIIEEAAEQPGPPANASVPAHWDSDGTGLGPSSASKYAMLPLPPPPRGQRRPWTSGDVPRRGGDIMINGIAEVSETEGASSHHGPRTPTPPVSPQPSLSPRIGIARPPSATSMSSYTSADRDRMSDLSRRPRTVPKMLAPPTGPPPSAPSPPSPGFNGPPSPRSDQQSLRQNGTGQSPWGVHPNPYSKRISTSSARSATTTSTAHSFLGAKSPPPPRPPPTFAPPPVPPPEQSDATSIHSTNRDSFLPRPLRLSLVPVAAPPAHPPPPRPDEVVYRHRRSNSSEVKSISNLHAISGSPPPAAPPPNGPLPPLPPPENDKDATTRPVRPSSLTQRMRILSTPTIPSPGQTTTALPRGNSPAPRPPSHTPPNLTLEPRPSRPEDDTNMFLSMNDTPTTAATTNSPSFLNVSSPLQTSIEDEESTSLSPPPRRNSRILREIQRAPNPEHDESKGTPNGDSLLAPRDSAVAIEQI